MSLSRGQQILLKRAQREAALSDEDYREALQTVSGCRSSTVPRLTDRHVDLALACFEAIFWRMVENGELQPSCKPDAVFRQKGFWAAKNPSENTSRDRFAASSISQEIARLELDLAALGFGRNYCAAIRQEVTNGQTGLRSDYAYKAALRRTLAAKQRKATAICAG